MNVSLLCNVKLSNDKKKYSLKSNNNVNVSLLEYSCFLSDQTVDYQQTKLLLCTYTLFSICIIQCVPIFSSLSDYSCLYLLT